MTIWQKKPKLFNALVVITLTLIATIIYSNTFSSPFVFDDLTSIVRNPKIKDLSNFLTWESITYPRVLVDITFALNYHFGQLNVFGYHLVNLIIHIINGVLVYFLALNIFTLLVSASQSEIRNSKFPIPQSLNPSIHIMSFVSALIFIAHPIQTQAVTYIVQRYTSMAAMFYLASVLFYILGRKKQKELTGSESISLSKTAVVVWIYFIFTAIFALFAFLSKQNTASLPGAILLVEYILFDQTWTGWEKKLKWIGPICVTFFIFIFYVVILKGQVNFGNLLEDVSTKTRDISGISRWEYLCTQFNVLVIYIRLLFFPVGQNLDYLYPFKSGFFDSWTPLAFISLISLLAIGVWQRKKRPIILLAILWFFLTLSIESSIIPIRDALFEHRLYLPIFGFSLIVSYLIFILLGKKKIYTISVCCLVIILMGVTAHLRNNVWQSNLKLWQDVTLKSPNNERAHYNLGNAWKRNRKFDKAISEYQKAIDLKPKYVKAHLNLGIVYYKKEEFRKARQHFQAALKTRPDYLKPRINLSLALIKLGKLEQGFKNLQKVLNEDPDNLDALFNLGVICENQGQPGRAIDYYKKVIKVQTNHFDARCNLANLLVKKGEVSKAIEHYKKALSLHPKVAEVHYNLGNALFQAKQLKRAEKHYNLALKLNPDLALSHYSLGNIYMQLNELKKANHHFKEILRLKPGLAQANYSMGLLKARQGNLKKAKIFFEKALDIKPGYVQAHVYLGLVLSNLGNFRKARQHFLTALQINPKNIRARQYLQKINKKISDKK